MKMHPVLFYYDDDQIKGEGDGSDVIDDIFLFHFEMDYLIIKNVRKDTANDRKIQCIFIEQKLT